jgi:hypothetical protein
MFRSFFVVIRRAMHYKERSTPVFEHGRAPDHIAYKGGHMAVLDVTKKAAIYHTLSQINSAFAAIVEHYQDLHKAGLLSARYMRLYQGFTRELQSEFNQDFLLALHNVEFDDWNRFGKVRQQWEKHLRAPGRSANSAGTGKTGTRKDSRDAPGKRTVAKRREGSSR